MCEHFKDDFIRQCIENANETQDTPEFSQLYRGEKKIFRLMYDNKKKRWWGIFGQSIIEEVLQDWVLENFPEFEQNDTRLAVFGPTTVKSVEDNGLRIDIEAPSKKAPSMLMALDQYIKAANKRVRK